MKTTYSKLLSAAVMAFAYFVTLSCEAGQFTLEIVQPSTGPDNFGTLRVMYHDEDDNFSFYNGGLHLQLSSSVGGVIKLHGGEIINSDERWAAAYVRDVADDSIGNLFAASLLTPGLTGTGSRIFADFQYSLIGSGSTELIIDAGGEDPVVEGPLGDIAHHVSSRGLCLGDCLPEHTPTVLNLGESWAQKRALLNSPPPAIPIPAPVWNPPVVVSPEDFKLEEDVPPSYYEPEESTPPLADDTSTPDPGSWFPGETVNDSPLVVTPVEILAPDTEIEDSGVFDTDSPVVIEIEQPNFDITYWQVIPVFSVVDGVVVQINTADGSVTPVVDSWFTRRDDFTGRLKSISEHIIANLRAQVIKTQTTSTFDLDAIHFGTTGMLAFSSSGTTVPEPSGFFLTIASTAAILMRRRLA